MMPGARLARFLFAIVAILIVISLVLSAAQFG
jgi:hypothetical protein